MAANGPPLQLPFGPNPHLPTLTLAGNPEPTLNPRLRKRTKTGCLTCRKRRVKCGEERPTCGNCIKSKRHCEGYSQRVVFKPPIEGGPGGSASTIPFHTGALPNAQPPFPRPAPFPGEQIYSSVQDQQPQYGIPIDDHGQPIPFSAQLGVFSGQTPQFQLPQSFTLPVISPQPNNFNSVPPALQSSNTLQSITSPIDQAFAQSQVSSLTTPVSSSSQYQYVSSPNFDQGFLQGQEPPTPLSAIRPDIKPIKLEPSIPTPPSTFSDSGDFQSSQPTATEYPWGQSGSVYSHENYRPAAFNTQTSGWTDPHTAFEQKPGISREFSGKTYVHLFARAYPGLLYPPFVEMLTGLLQERH
jgi:Fungal Zn(2)-Cys(6) binuclear cluster domain